MAAARQLGHWTPSIHILVDIREDVWLELSPVTRPTETIILHVSYVEKGIYLGSGEMVRNVSRLSQRTPEKAIHT